ncbi:pyridoxal phosphate-dependent transferase [Xylariomycetidae sp. FL2044]|nr:pyridoxal phosphate-dependent transferase [Xylariomycetidae sp. FL2044]
MLVKTPVERELINLQGGWPTPRLHPSEAMSKAAAELFASPNINELLRYGTGAGHPSLRKNIARWLSRAYQQPGVVPERIVVTNGASNGLATILQKYTDPGVTKYVWMVEPTYFLASSIIRDAGFADRIRAVPEGAGGVDLDFLQRVLEKAEGEPAKTPVKTAANGYPKIYQHILYMVPTFSNPSGRTMSIKDRQDLIRVARKYDVLIITDDVYDFLCWPGSQDGDQKRACSIPPRMVDIDRTMAETLPFGNAVSNGSFSKIIAPGVRVGWLEATPAFASTMVTVGATRSGGNQAHLASLIIDRMLENDDVETHVRDLLIPTYRHRYYVFIEAIHHFLYPLGVRIITDTSTGEEHKPDPDDVVAGGFFLYIMFPDYLPPASVIAERALVDYDLKIGGGALFTVTDDPTKDDFRSDLYLRGARLCWAWHEQEQLVEGIERLAELIKDLSDKKLT